MEITPILLARFWSKVDVRGPGQCWPWRGARDKHGYGRFHTTGHIGTCLAHRLAFFLINGGDTEAEIDVCHRCDNPPCCNPDHMWAGNALENVCDAIQKGRFFTGPGRRGSTNGNSKLNEDQVITIRANVAAGRSLTSVAQEFSVGLSTVSQICRRETWTHIK
jgi:hypothetical protein